jgi:hypothetical protein
MVLEEPVSLVEMKNLKLVSLDGNYAICRLVAGMVSPEWSFGGPFYSITRTPDEISIICLHEQVPENIQCQPGWRLLKIEGPFEFDEIGVLASLTAPLADAQISLLTISTFDTDYILIQEDNFPQAVHILAAAGHKID